MKINVLVFCLSFTIVGTAQASIVCGGWNKKNKPVVLKIEDTGKISSSGFKSVNVLKVAAASISNPTETGKSVSQPLDGCQEALFAGQVNQQLTKKYTGDLYVECDGDGDAGFMELKRTGSGKYKGRFVAPNGNKALNLNDEEEISLTCSSK